MERATSFGRYQLIKQVGAGGMARVHLARQVGEQGFVKPCVVKVLAEDLQGDEKCRQMFLEEARLAALLNHPAIAQTFDFGDVGGIPYMAMELVDGVNLAQLCRSMSLAQSWMPLNVAIEICIQVLDALHYAHELKALDGRRLHVVHRDVSPQNILIARQGTVKLVDFGIARHEARETLTVGTSAKVKPGYMAPEQMTGTAIDRRADLFATGVVLAELLGRRRARRKDQRILALFDVRASIEGLLGRARNLPPRLRDIVLRMTALEPDDRHETAAEAAGELREVLSHDIAREVRLDVFAAEIFESVLPETLQALTQDRSLPSSAFSASVDDGWREDEEALDHARNSAADGPHKDNQDRAHLDAGAPKTREAQSASEAREAPETTKAPEAPETSAPPEPAWTSAVYEGWPEEFLRADPKFELVVRSSRIEAMDFFRAQGPSEQGAESNTPHSDTPHSGTRHGDTSQSRSPRPTPDIPRSGQAQSHGHGHGQSTRPMPGAATKATRSTADRAAPGVVPRMPEAPSGAAGSAPSAIGRATPPPAGSSLDLSTDKRWANLVGGDTAHRKRSSGVVRARLLRSLLVAGVIGLVSFSAIALLTPSRSPPAPERSGTIHVSSDPEGADIFLNGASTGLKTPAGVTMDRSGVDCTISIAREGFISEPPRLELVAPNSKRQIDARFRLLPARRFRFETSPPGAHVAVNSHSIDSITPLTSPYLPTSESSTVSLVLAGYLPQSILIPKGTATSSVIRVVLEAGRTVDLLSEPPGADVQIDRTSLGRTPLYDALIPAKRRARLTMTKPGYKQWTRDLRPNQKKPEQQLIATLVPRPLLSIPMNKDDRKRARLLVGKLREVEQNANRVARKLKVAQAELARVEASPSFFLTAVAKSQAKVDALSQSLDELNERREDLETEIRGFRAMLLSEDE